MDLPVTSPAQIPATVEVICGTLRGTYDVAKTKILYLSNTGGIREATPTEFERLGGRQATKKWKQSIRVVDSHGQAGKSLGEWLAGTAGTAGEGQRQAFAWLSMGQRTGGGWAEGGGEGSRGGAAQSRTAPLREQFQLQLLDFLSGRIDNPGAGPGRLPQPGAKFGPVAVGSHSFDLQKMYSTVRELGGYVEVAAIPDGWKDVAEQLGLDKSVANTAHACRSVYEHYLLRAERLERAREAAGIPLSQPGAAQNSSPTGSDPSSGGGGGSGEAHVAIPVAAAAAMMAAPPPPLLKHESHPLDLQAAAAASQRALSAAAAAQQQHHHQLERPAPAEGRGGVGRRGAAAAPPPGSQKGGATAAVGRSGSAEPSGQYEHRRGARLDEGVRSVREGPGGRGPYVAPTGRNAGGGGGSYDPGLGEGRVGYDGLEREEYDEPGSNEYDGHGQGGYDALPPRSGYSSAPRGGYDSVGRGGYDNGDRGGYDGSGGYDSGSRRSFHSGVRGGYDRGGRGGYESGHRNGYGAAGGGRGGYDSGGGGRGYAFASRLYDGPAGPGGGGARYRQDHPFQDRRLALEALLQGAHAVQPQLVRSYDSQYEQRSSLLPLDINDDQLLLAAGLGLQGAAGRDSGGSGGPVINPLLLDSSPGVGRQHSGSGGGSLVFGRDVGGGGSGGRLQLQLGGGRQHQDSREAMLVTLTGASVGGSGGGLSTRGGLMQAIEQAGLVSLASRPASSGGRLLPVSLGRGGGGGGCGETLHPGWLSRAAAVAAAAGGRSSGSGSLQLQSSRAAALLGLQGSLAEGVMDDPMVSNMLSDYLGGGGMPVGLVRTGSGNIGLSSLGGLSLAGGGGGGYKRGQTDLGGAGSGMEHGGGGGGNPHKRQAL